MAWFAAVMVKSFMAATMIAWILALCLNNTAESEVDLLNPRSFNAVPQHLYPSL